MQIKRVWKCKGCKQRTDWRMRHAEKGILDNVLSKGQGSSDSHSQGAKVAFPVCVGMVLISLI